MYKHDLTEEGEYPRTVREVLHHSVDMLTEQFPERVVLYKVEPEHFHQHFSAAGYEWPGAGSEKGGSAEHIAYERVLFLPERDGKVQAVSVGDRQYDFSNSILIKNEDGALSDYRPQSAYSVLFQLGVGSSFAERFLGYYHAHVKNVDKRNISFTVAIDRLLECGTNHFYSVPLFAFDSSRIESPGTFFLNKYGAVQNSGDLERFSSAWDWYLKGDLGLRKKVSGYIQDYLLGNKGEETLRDERFTRAGRRGLHSLSEGREERILKSLP